MDDANTHHLFNDNPDVRKVLNGFLKNSDYFHSALNEVRAATGALLAEFLKLFQDAGVLSDADVATMLFLAEKGTAHPSYDSTRRHLIASIRARMQSDEPPQQ